MAYESQHTWWLQGPSNPMGGGCDGGCNGGVSGLGQVCPAGFTMDDTGTCSQASCDFPYVLSNGVCVTGTTLIPGIPDSYLYIGGAVIAAFLLMGVLKK